VITEESPQEYASKNKFNKENKIEDLEIIKMCNSSVYQENAQCQLKDRLMDTEKNWMFSTVDKTDRKTIVTV